MATQMEWGNTMFPKNYILQRNEDGSGEIYIEKEGEILVVAPIYASLRDVQRGTKEPVMTGVDFLRRRGGVFEQIPHSDFRKISNRALARLDRIDARRRIRAALRQWRSALTIFTQNATPNTRLKTTANKEPKPGTDSAGN
jgi:hypothetical protein